MVARGGPERQRHDRPRLSDAAGASEQLVTPMPGERDKGAPCPQAGIVLSLAFEHVVWLGGGTGSGKSTVARLLAARQGLRCFRVDDFWYAHDARLDETRLTPDEQWLGLTPEEQAAAFEETSRRRFQLVLADLVALPTRPGIVVEGPQILPDLLPPGAAAVFLVPTAELQRSLLAQRPLPPTANPRLALENRIEKDRLFAERVASQAAARGYELVRVDGRRSPDELTDAVEQALRPGLDPNGGQTDLRSARRWENDILARNVRSWLASTDTLAEPPASYAFVCECGRRGCAEQVLLSLDEYDATRRAVSPLHAADDAPPRVENDERSPAQQ